MKGGLCLSGSEQQQDFLSTPGSLLFMFTGVKFSELQVKQKDL